jgi:diguanylate cyclase (GGDEF)-like protein
MGIINMSREKTIPAGTQIAIVLCISFVILIWAGLLYDSKRSEDIVLQQGRKDVSNLAIAFRENITGVVSAIDQLTIAIGADHANHPDDYSIPEWVTKSPLLQGIALQVSLQGPDGIVRASNLPFNGRIDSSDRPHFRYHLDPSASQPYISVPVVSRVSGKWSVQVTRRLTRDDGRFDGIVVVSIDPFYLSKIFDNVNLGKGGNAVVVGRDGIVRARRALDDQGLGQDLTNSELLQKVQTASEGTFIRVGKLNGVQSVFGYASLQTYPLIVNVAMPTDEILATVRHQNSANIVFGGIATIALLALAWLLVRDSKRRRQQELAQQVHAALDRENNVQFDAALNNMSQGLVMFDSSNRLIVCNQRYLEMYGLSPEAVRPGRTLQEVVDCRIAAGNLFLDGGEQSLADFRVSGGQNTIYRKTINLPDKRNIQIVNCPVPGGGWVATHEDVTEQRRTEERFAYAAKHDALTGLPNRKLYYERLEQALKRVQRGERLAVLYLDLDHLKRVNDTLGHPIGDKLLKGVADRLRGCVRDIDYACHLSGDEFAIIQTMLDQPSDAAALAMRIREAIVKPFDLDGHQVKVDVSIGISVAPDDATELTELLKTADIALYEAKNTGRGTYCFYEPAMNARMQTRVTLERDLQSALANGEFELFYQPVVSLENNKISSFEALLRWNHPERGLVSPAEFIPVTEEMGLIIPLGEWVLRTACAEAANWPDDIQVAVNVSSVQLASKNLVNTVIGAIASAGIRSNRLELEITESVLVQNTFTNLATLNGLHELGVQFAMDDFGTAYSSLGYLLSFPFHRIKIDRGFIANLSNKREHRAVVRAITELGRNLNMRVTAEGVETEKQLQQVRLLGCTELQGYLLSRPRPAAEILQLFASQFESADSLIAVNALAGQNNSKMCTIRPDLECNHRLTERECSILTGIVAGDSCEESSVALKISLRTIKVYRGRIMAKLGAKNSADLIRVMLTTGCSPSRSKSIGYSQSPEIKVAVTALGASVKKPESDPGAPRRVRAAG